MNFNKNETEVLNENPREKKIVLHSLHKDWKLKIKL